MNNLLLGGQECTDSIDVEQSGSDIIDCNMTAIILHLNFTCNSRITSIRARLFVSVGSDTPFSKCDDQHHLVLQF